MREGKREEYYYENPEAGHKDFKKHYD